MGFILVTVLLRGLKLKIWRRFWGRSVGSRV